MRALETRLTESVASLHATYADSTQRRAIVFVTNRYTLPGTFIKDTVLAVPGVT
jgi:hypothetical protein